MTAMPSVRTETGQYSLQKTNVSLNATTWEAHYLESQAMSKNSLPMRLAEGLIEVATGDIHHMKFATIVDKLDGIWHPSRPQPPRAQYALATRRTKPPKRPPPWFIGMSSSFSNDIRKIDRKLQGRILEAITEITQEPMVLRGDTIKPLVGDFQGCWRYRLGDFRLIYFPDKDNGDVTLLTFASRGSAYVD